MNVKSGDDDEEIFFNSSSTDQLKSSPINTPATDNPSHLVLTTVLDKAGEMVPFSALRQTECVSERKPIIPENPSKGGLVKAPKCNYHPSLVQRTLLRSSSTCRGLLL